MYQTPLISEKACNIIQIKMMIEHLMIEDYCSKTNSEMLLLTVHLVIL